MALFGIGKKREVQEQTAPGSPIDQVRVLRQRGMSNDQIIPELERQGYNSSQIFDALNKLSMSEDSFGQGPKFNMPQQNFPPSPQASPPQTSYSQNSYPQTPPTQQDPYAPPPFEEIQQQEAPIDKSDIEEVAEAIIDEKWQEIEEGLKVVIEWKEQTETKIEQIEQRIKEVANNLNNLQKSMLGKISDYDKNIMDVGTEMKAMEKIFQKILPGLTESVNKLDRIAKSSKTGVNK
jgi:DNA-binding transcriptional MerR regulator